MALNPFFLHGSSNEQRLVQELINEQLRMFGVEVTYIPRKFVRKETILQEITSSRFDDNFSIEVYVNNYDGYTGQGDLLTKFGVSIKDEVTLTISRERFEDFIAPFIGQDEESNFIANRPREGDLIYFPLGGRIFEVKFVEHEQPFYQLGNLYVYELKCELFEYEDEVINTSIDEIDNKIENEGYIATLRLSGIGATATVFPPEIGSGGIKKIYLNNDGYGYSSTPIVSITPAPAGGDSATAIAVVKSRSIKEILLTNPGFGYTETPKISITGGGGIGAAATCEITPISGITSGVRNVVVDIPGSGYVLPPTISFSEPTGVGESAEGVVRIDSEGRVTSVLISNSGIGYTESPIVTISPPSTISGTGNFEFNEIVTGSKSGTIARVKSWYADSKILNVSYINDVSDKGFYPGEIIVGSSSSARYIVSSFDSFNNYDKYSDNIEIEVESDKIIDFSEANPFGNY